MKAVFQTLFRRILHELREFCFFVKQSVTDLQNVYKIDVSWFSVWVSIYSGFILLDIFFPGFWGSDLLKYTGIFLCVVYARKEFPQDVPLAVALFLTFCSDTILVWTPFEWLGVLIFCFAQFMHTIRLTKASAKTIIIYAGTLVGMYCLARTQGVSPLYAIAGFYAITLLMNVLISIRNYRLCKTDFRARCAFYGFVLFLGCDICVGLRHLILDGVISSTFLPLIAFLVWVFYYPSQVVLANSSNLPVEEAHKRQKIAKTKRLE